MRAKYRAALSGLGNIAWRMDKGREPSAEAMTHAFAYLRHPGIELAGGCSPDLADREAFEKEFGLPSFEDYSSMLEALAPDVLSICSPASVHFSQAREALECGVPMIWLEKPPGEYLQEVLELVSLNEARSKSTVIVNYMRRYMPTYAALRDIVHSRQLGKAVMVQVNYSRGLEPNGSHMADLLFFVLGEDADYELEWVSTSISESSPSFALRVDGGPMAFFCGADLPYHNIDFSVTFERGRASVLHGAMSPVLETRAEHEIIKGGYRLKQQEGDPLGQGGFHDCMRKALEDLLYCHKTGVAPVSGLRTAVASQRLMAMVRDHLGDRQ